MHIKWENPTLNKQLKHADLTLSFRYYSLSSFYIYVHIHIYFFVLITFCVITIVIILPCIKCSARASVPCLAHLKIVFSFFEILNCITF